jgi:hypothetical protein
MNSSFWVIEILLGCVNVPLDRSFETVLLYFSFDSFAFKVMWIVVVQDFFLY